MLLKASDEITGILVYYETGGMRKLSHAHSSLGCNKHQSLEDAIHYLTINEVTLHLIFCVHVRFDQKLFLLHI